MIVLVRRQDRWRASHYAQISGRLPRASRRGFEAVVRGVVDPRAERYGSSMLLDHAALREVIAPAVSDLLLMPHEALARAKRPWERCCVTSGRPPTT